MINFSVRTFNWEDEIGFYKNFRAGLKAIFIFRILRVKVKNKMLNFSWDSEDGVFTKRYNFFLTERILLIIRQKISGYILFNFGFSKKHVIINMWYRLKLNYFWFIGRRALEITVKTRNESFSKLLRFWSHVTSQNFVTWRISSRFDRSLHPHSRPQLHLGSFLILLLIPDIHMIP